MAEAALLRAARDELIGDSAPMRHLREQVRRLATCDVTVLLQGESGTGKEVVARAIHGASHRRDRPFIGVNCGAVNETILESELFGHQAGAFTGARHATLGFFRAADGGTLLLDEIGDMGESLQSSLLRVLEEQAVTPVGATQAIPIDVRVIAASHRDLAEAVRKGRFREDLYYRLNVICLSMAPLRQRREDIPPLVEYLLGRIADLLNLPAKGITESAMDALVGHNWPGNVRQLSNIIQRAYVLGHHPLINLNDLPTDLQAPGPRPSAGFPPLQDAIRTHVERALELSGGT